MRVRILATASAALIHLGLAALIMFDRGTQFVSTELTPAIAVSLARPPVPAAPPRPVRRSLKGGDMKPVAPPNHRLVGASPGPSLFPITAPSPVPTATAAVLEHTPDIARLAPNPMLSTAGAIGASAGGGDLGSGVGAGAGTGGAGQGLGMVELSAWIHRPTAAELESYYPSPARRQGVKGMAVLACAVTADTRVRACHVLAERPPWEGFGTAALAMTKLFRIRPTLVDGKVYEKARVAIPVYFGTSAPED